VAEVLVAVVEVSVVLPEFASLVLQAANNRLLLRRRLKSFII
jgi:hypothetical protein